VRVIRQHDHGEDVRDVQHRLIALGHAVDADELDGTFGGSTAAAVRAFQQQRGLLVDGDVGPETWFELVEAGYSLGDRIVYLRYPYFRGDDVRALQRRLNSLGFDAGREDGIFGERTDRAVRDFQKNVGQASDGIVGPETQQAIERLRPPIDAPGRHQVREAEVVSRMSSTLSGALLAVDAGHGGDDVGAEVGGIREADLTLQIASDVADELERRGAQPVLLRDDQAAPAVRDRVKMANAAGAEVCLSIHLNHHQDPAAEGSSAYFYGAGASHSPAGQRLADLIQEELVSRLGLLDGRTHPISIAMLRETRMPAVQIEPCFITNPREGRLLREPGFRRDVAIAIVRGLERFFDART
jgi:N-acetylmuramoyl-L-alanine amidase